MRVSIESYRYPLFAIGPEGTTKHSDYLLQFSTGAFVGGQPVIPILLKYKCKYAPGSCSLLTPDDLLNF